MAALAFTWTGNAGTQNWEDVGNWSGGESGHLYPVAGDQVTIAPASSSTATPLLTTAQYAAQLIVDAGAAIGFGTGGSLTVTATADYPASATSIDNNGEIVLNGGSLTEISTDASGITNGATGIILVLGGGTLGGGTLGAGTLGISNAGQLTVLSGTLTVDGIITDTGASQITVGSGTTLYLTGLANDSGSVTVNGTLVETGSAQLTNGGTLALAGGTLQSLGNGGLANSGTLSTSGSSSLEMGLANAIANSGIINVTSGMLAVIGNITESGTSQINISSGATFGTVSALANDSGTITLTGGTLEVLGSGVLTNGGTITASGASALSVANPLANTGSIAVTSGTLSVTGSITDSGTSQIDISSGATLSVSAQLTNSAGQITLNGGTLTDSAGLALNGGTVSGHGTINLSTGNLTGAGTLYATGGTLLVTATIDPSGAATSFEIADSAALILSASSAVGTASINPALTFDPQTHLAAPELFKDVAVSQTDLHLGTITGFSGSDEIELQALSSTGADTISYGTNTITITGTAGTQTYTFSASTNVKAISLSTVGNVDTLTICFMAGTRVRTPDGEAAIETLHPGALLLTAEGAVRPVNWLGRQTVHTGFADPLRCLPVRILAGALAETVPSRDLLVSPDHALLVDDVLINAGALVNGSTIIRETEVPETFVYYHIELDDHALILAENTPAETFIDNVDRGHFDNWAEFEALYPHGKQVAELPYPRAKSQRQIPGAIRSRLAARARALTGRAAA